MERQYPAEACGSICLSFRALARLIEFSINEFGNDSKFVTIFKRKVVFKRKAKVKILQQSKILALHCSFKSLSSSAENLFSFEGKDPFPRIRLLGFQKTLHI